MSVLPFDPYRSSIISIALGFLSRGILRGRLVVASGKGKTYQATKHHPALELLKRPNPWYDRTTLIKALVLETLGSRTGDCFLVKARASSGEPIGLVLLPGWTVHAHDPGRIFRPEHWIYRAHLGAEGIKLPLSEVIHFRAGVNPEDPNRGLSDFEYAGPELATDVAISTLSASLARNMGIPGIIIAPTEGETIAAEDVSDIERGFRLRTTGDNAGKPIVLRGSVEVTKLGPPPSSMMLDNLARWTGERLVARLGLSFLGLGIPDSRGTHQNFGEAARSNWDNGVLPLAHSMAEALTHQLLRPDYSGPASQRFEFDFRHVEVFAEDAGKLAKRTGTLFQNGVLQRDEARAAVGFKALGGEDGDFIKSTPPTRQSIWDEFTKSLPAGARKALAHLRPKAVETKVVLSLDTPSTRKG